MCLLFQSAGGKIGGQHGVTYATRDTLSSQVSHWKKASLVSPPPMEVKTDRVSFATQQRGHWKVSCTLGWKPIARFYARAAWASALASPWSALRASMCIW